MCAAKGTWPNCSVSGPKISRTRAGPWPPHVLSRRAIKLLLPFPSQARRRTARLIIFATEPLSITHILRGRRRKRDLFPGLFFSGRRRVHEHPSRATDRRVAGSFLSGERFARRRAPISTVPGRDGDDGLPRAG